MESQITDLQNTSKVPIQLYGLTNFLEIVAELKYIVNFKMNSTYEFIFNELEPEPRKHIPVEKQKVYINLWSDGPRGFGKPPK